MAQLDERIRELERNVAGSPDDVSSRIQLTNAYARTGNHAALHHATWRNIDDFPLDPTIVSQFHAAQSAAIGVLIRGENSRATYLSAYGPKETMQLPDFSSSRIDTELFADVFPLKNDVLLVSQEGNTVFMLSATRESFFTTLTRVRASFRSDVIDVVEAEDELYVLSRYFSIADPRPSEPRITEEPHVEVYNTRGNRTHEYIGETRENSHYQWAEYGLQKLRNAVYMVHTLLNARGGSLASQRVTVARSGETVPDDLAKDVIRAFEMHKGTALLKCKDFTNPDKPVDLPFMRIDPIRIHVKNEHDEMYNPPFVRGQSANKSTYFLAPRARKSRRESSLRIGTKTISSNIAVAVPLSMHAYNEIHERYNPHST